MEEKLSTVGVIGGGQLAWMMAREAPRLGLKLAVQTPSLEDPAVSLATQTVIAPIAAVDGTQELAGHCGVITFENEFVDLPNLEKLAQQGISFYPRLNSLHPLLDKWEQRQFLTDLGLPVPDFWNLESLPSPLPAFPLVLKARRHGYDGQGTQIIASAAQLQPLDAQGNWLVEALVPYERELAVVAGRNPRGQVAIYPVAETRQVEQVCRSVIVPAPVEPEITTTIATYCRRILEHLDYVGVLAIELFLLPRSPDASSPEQRLLINELAPRTHNSGHFSLDACPTSQFALQLQAVTGQSLGVTSLNCAQAVMVNLLGYENCDKSYEKSLAQLGTLPHCYVHWYGKGALRPGRKLGHVTVLRPLGSTPEFDLAWAQNTIEKIEELWCHT